jgi:hypothetical protein
VGVGFIINALCLIGLAGSGGMIAAGIKCSDIDNAAYVPKFLYYIEHPQAPFNFAITPIAYGGGILRFPIAAMPRRSFLRIF